MKVFIDSSPFIYMVEGGDSYADRVETQLGQWISAGMILSTSALTLMELLVVPKKMKDGRLVRKYHALLQNLLSEPLITLDGPVAERAAQIRADFGFKTADSIQLAAAMESGADIFYTNDLRLSKFPDLTILTVDG